MSGYNSHLASGSGNAEGGGSKNMGMEAVESRTATRYNVFKVKYLTCVKCKRGIDTAEKLRWSCTWCGEECGAEWHMTCRLHFKGICKKLK